ncbi:MAG: glutathione S-transferase N-terminal domain-containing protein, partial [Planctomycetota bacterium]|nr:glutathione S-transferase N-terminal domain-containing protein [Planctomycetota bacterium]
MPALHLVVDGLADVVQKPRPAGQAAVQAEFQKYAKLPLVPLVVTPDGEGIQDSTPIIERFEAKEPALATGDGALDFISALLEEYGDEWGNKWMFHYRWRYQPDVWSTAERIAQQRRNRPAQRRQKHARHQRQPHRRPRDGPPRLPGGS